MCILFSTLMEAVANKDRIQLKIFKDVSRSDLPQTARWKVTSKEALQRIGEYSEAAITIRGTYFPPGKEPKEGERKIYLAIESMCQGNQFQVFNAFFKNITFIMTFLIFL